MSPLKLLYIGKSSEGLMEPSKTHEQSWYNSMETRNEGHVPSGQRYLQDPSGSINTNARLPELNVLSGVKPVLNYSFQTGEEFALEFMRERAYTQKLFVPKAPPDWSGNPVYTDLRMLGITHMGSESGSDVSMLVTGEKGLVKEVDKQGSCETENISYYESARSVPRTLSGDGSSRGVAHGYTLSGDGSSRGVAHGCTSSGASDNSSMKVKFLCSFDGKILPRPSDAKLRYVGGDTRIVQINKDISWQELVQKTLSIYNQAHTIKYQLPGEDLDALVSVSCDEDMQNMMEEFSVLEGGGGSQKLRMFLFSASDLEDTHFVQGSIEGDSEIQYVVAVNGVDLGPAKNSSDNGLVSTSANVLDQLFSLNVGGVGETSGAQTGSVGTNVAPLTGILVPPSTTVSLMPMEATLSNDCEPCVQSYQNQIMHLGESDLPPFSAAHPLDNLTNVDSQEPLQGSTPFDAENANQTHEPDEDHYYYTSGGAFPPAYANSESDQTDFSYSGPPLLPQRVFHSEWIPREQAELMNQLSKSDDSIGPHYSLPHPGLVPQVPISESVDISHEGNPSSQSEQSNVSPKTPLTNPTTFVEGLENYKRLNDSITHMNHREPMFAKEGLVSANFTQLPQLSGRDESVLNHNLHGLEKDSNSGETRSSTGAVPQEESSFTGGAPPERGDILIDINDNFPPNLLSDIFSEAGITEDATGISPMRQEDTALSLNVQNHEPKRWSFFRNLAQDVRKDVSLMDQDHVVFPSPLTKVEEGPPKVYAFSPIDGEGVSMGHVDTQSEFPSQVILTNLTEKTTQGVQAEGISFSKLAGELRPSDLDFEEEKLEVGHAGEPFADSSVGEEFDIFDLQIIKNGDLEELRELGSGTFGTVYHGKWRGSDVAIKRIKKSCFTGRSSEQERLTLEFWREAAILSKLHHPNIVAFYGVVQDGPGATLATVAEYMVNGSLRHVLLRKDRYLDRRKRLIIATDAAFGMEYLHSKNIVHFDLKCDNLLVNLKDPLRPICKVGDFGLSKIKRNTLVSGGVRGTLPWMAPELLNGGSNKVSEKVDVFSFGIVMWEILTGEEPYANMHYGAIIGGIVNNTLRPPVPSFCDPEWRRLMEECWAPDSGARPSFTEIASRLRVMSVAVQSKTPTSQAQNKAFK
ncbi:RAF-like serine/threonine-protein kinase 20 [Tasmannia lanceolata]|uniref:RAF-like serine/threonine-protein kinase 20 n=1 Tax=Tasmannia lanceolata TaxID=3420 RepID=UPI004062CF12